MPATASENPSSFHIETEREVEEEEEQIEGGDSQLPLQPIQEQSCALTPSRTIPDLGNTSNESWQIPFINNNQWEEFLNLQINKVFE